MRGKITTTTSRGPHSSLFYTWEVAIPLEGLVEAIGGTREDGVGGLQVEDWLGGEDLLR